MAGDPHGNLCEVISLRIAKESDGFVDELTAWFIFAGRVKHEPAATPHARRQRHLRGHHILRIFQPLNPLHPLQPMKYSLRHLLVQFRDVESGAATRHCVE